MGGQGIEKIGGGGLPAAHQNGIGGNFLIEMAFAGAPGAQFAQVVVVLHQGHHALQKMQLFPVGKRLRLHALAAQKQIHPLLRGEIFPLRNDVLQIQVGQLNGLQADDVEGRIRRSEFPLFAPAVVLVLYHVVGNAGDAPDATHENLGKFDGIFAIDHELADLQIGKSRHIIIIEGVQMGGNLVNDRIRAPFPNEGFDFFAFLRTHVIFRQNFSNFFDPSGDGGLVVCGAVHAQQVFQHEGGHVGPAL